MKFLKSTTLIIVCLQCAHSTRQCNTFRQDTVKNLGWRKVSELSPRSSVDFCLHLFDFQFANVFKSLFFRHILSYQAICVFVATALPRRVRVSEIKIGSEFFRDLLMSGKFCPVIGCKCLNISFIWQQCVDPHQFVNSFMTDHWDAVDVRVALDLLRRPLFRSHFFNNLSSICGVSFRLRANLSFLTVAISSA